MHTHLKTAITSITMITMIMIVVSIALTACSAGMQLSKSDITSQSSRKSLVRVTVTSQGHIFHRPWQQRRTVTGTAIGVIVPGGQVLVQADLVADQRYIELETIDTQIKHPARVAVVDYESNLALVEPLEKDFLADLRPMELAGRVATGDQLAVLQVKPNGDVVPGPGKVTSIELGVYASGDYFLTYRLDNTLQYRFNNLTLPVVKGSQLAGILLRQSGQGRSIEVIALPVIEHFLKDVAQGEYRGFPTAGFHSSALLDVQLRRYLEIPDALTGIYVQKVIKGSPADRAGIQAGDVVTRMGDMDVSNTGQYQHPIYGQTALAHLIRTRYHVGDRVAVALYRDKAIVETTMVLDHRRPEEYLVPPYVFDRTSDYLIVGGLVILELTVPYLQEYGKDWLKNAPVGLLYYSQNQDYLNGDSRNKIVLVSAVFPTPETIGYETLSDLELLQVNGQPIGKIADVKTALLTPRDGFHKFEIKQHPKAIYLDAGQVGPINRLIETNYRIPIPSLNP